MATAVSLKTDPSPMTLITTVDDALPFADRVVAYIGDSDYFGQEGYTLESDSPLRFGYVKKNITRFPACKNGKVNLDADFFWEDGLILARLLKSEEFPSNYGKGNSYFSDPDLSLGYAKYIDACDSNLAALQGTVNKVGNVARGLTNTILKKHPISIRPASFSEALAIHEAIEHGNASLVYMFDKEKSCCILGTHLQRLKSASPNSSSTQSFKNSGSDQKEDDE